MSQMPTHNSQAETLSQIFYQFGRLTQEGQENSIRTIIEGNTQTGRSNLKSLVTPEVLDALRPHEATQEALAIAIDKALRTQIVVDGRGIDNWAGERIVAVILEKSRNYPRLLGFFNSPGAERSLDPAIGKALVAMMLEDGDNPSASDLIQKSTRRHLSRLWLHIPVNMFLGGQPASRLPDFPEVYIAIGGVEPNQAYVANVLGLDPTTKTKESLASMLEMFLGRLVKMYLHDPKREVIPVDEPDEIGQIRIYH